MQNRMQKSNFSFNFVLSTHKCKWQNSFQILVWKLQSDQYWCAVLCGTAQSCQRTFAKFTVQFSQCSYPCWKCLLELSLVGSFNNELAMVEAYWMLKLWNFAKVRLQNRHYITQLKGYLCYHTQYLQHQS